MFPSMGKLGNIVSATKVFLNCVPSVAEGFTLGSNILDFNIFYSCFDHLTVRILLWVAVYSAHNKGGLPNVNIVHIVHFSDF